MGVFPTERQPSPPIRIRTRQAQLAPRVLLELRRALRLPRTLPEESGVSAGLSRVAQSPTIAEVLERIAERSGGRVGLQTAVDDLHDERARR